jgi:hypothetical protein
LYMSICAIDRRICWDVNSHLWEDPSWTMLLLVGPGVWLLLLLLCSTESVLDCASNDLSGPAAASLMLGGCTDPDASQSSSLSSGLHLYISRNN